MGKASTKLPTASIMIGNKWEMVKGQRKYLLFKADDLLFKDLLFKMGVVACTCNPATLGTKFWNGFGGTPVGGNSPSIGEWIV